MYGRRYGLGFIKLSPEQVNVIQRATNGHTSGFAKQAHLTSGPKIAPAPAGNLVAETVRAKSTPLVIHPDFNPGEDMRFRYSDDQIREMLSRGKSETVERSGETDGGLPIESDLEQRSRESSATAIFDTGESAAPVTLPKKKPNLLPIILAGVAAYYFV